MIEDFLLSPYALKFIATLLGSCAVLASSWGLTHPRAYEAFLRDLPRNRTWARGLLIVNVVWSAPLTANFLQSMEVPDSRLWMVYWILAPLVFFVIWFYVDHYLGARMLGWFLILLAKPVLFACLVRDNPSKFVLVVLAYYWIVVGMFIVAAPHFLRDWIDFCLQRPNFVKRSMQFKGVVGLVLIGLGLFVY
jgi:hypothetical protein